MPLIENPASSLVPKLKGLHLFGFDGAPCTQRVLLALGEKGIFRGQSVEWCTDAPKTLEAKPGTYTNRQVSLIKKQHLTDEYAAIQPNMVVPALVHDGRLYIESMDIVKYLDEAWPENPLTPPEPDAAKLSEALVEQGKALHVSVRYVSFHWGLGSLAKLNEQEEATIKRLEKTDSPEKLYDFYSRYDKNAIEEATYRSHLEALEAGWLVQEKRLADGRPFLTGSTFTAADIIWVIKTLRIEECGYPFAKNFPALHDWYQRMKQRPSFKRGLMAHHRSMSTVFKLKAAAENLLGRGIRKAARKAA